MPTQPTSKKNAAPKATVKAKPASEKEVVYAAAKRHGIPGWLLWGMYGAENSWDPNNGVQFGLIETTYPQLNGGKGRTVKNPRNIAETSDIAAELIASLKKEHGGLAGAVLAYSGGEYSISHPQQLANSNSSKGAMVPVSLLEEAIGGSLLGPLGKAVGGAGILGEGAEAAGGALAEATGLDGLLGPLEDVGQFFRAAGELLFTPEGWVRLAKMVGGAILFLWGLENLIGASKVVNKTTSTAGKVAEIAALVK